jgi:hypothetical protein
VSASSDNNNKAQQYEAALRDILRRLEGEKALGGGRYPPATVGLALEIESLVRLALEGE